MKVLLSDLSENQEKFQALHAGEYIGSSTIGAICGVNKYVSPLQLWLERTGRVKPEAREESDRLWFGKRIEPVLFELFGRKNDKRALAADCVLQSEKYPWAIASPDAFVYADSSAPVGLLETKTANFNAGRQWKDGATDAAHLQLIWQLGVAGDFDRGYVFALIDGDPNAAQTHEYPKSDSLFSLAVEAAERFVEMVRADTPPPARGDDWDSISKALKPADYKECDLAPEYAEKIAALEECTAKNRELSKAAKELEANIKALKSDLVLAMQGATLGRCGDKSVFAKVQKRAGFTVDPVEYVTLTVKGA